MQINMQLFLALFAISFGVASAETLVDGDTIIVKAEVSPRVRRHVDTFVDTSSGYDAIVMSSQCTTMRGKMGTCRKIDECYPFLFPLNKTVTHNGPTMNNELTNILIEVSGICDMPTFSAKFDSQSFNHVLNADFLICCPNPIVPNVPMMPPPQPEVEEQTKVVQMTKSCSQTQSATNETGEDRVVGGREAKPGEFPFIVALMNRRRQFCGGSLISTDWVLTAAHCVQHMAASDVANLQLYLGDHDIYNANDVPIQIRSASMILYNKHFSMTTLQSDIGLIKLSSPVTYSKSIQPVCLHGESSVDKKAGELAGWGQLCEGCQQPSKLRTARVNIWTHAECKKKYASIIEITEGMLCSGGKGQDSCRGDSGGPLTINSKTNPEQVGLVSFGVECGEHPGVYTRVGKYINWINRNIQKSKKKP